MSAALRHPVWILPGILLGVFVLIGRDGSSEPAPSTAQGTGASAPQVSHASASEGAGVEWRNPVEVATGEGYQGPWRMNDSDFRYVDAPTVALTPDGGVVVVWVDQSTRDLRLQRWSAEGESLLDEPTDVSRSPHTFSWLPRVQLGGSHGQEVHVLWQEIVFSGGGHGGEIYFARSDDGGRSFSDPLNVSDTPAGAGKGRLTRDRWDNGSLELVSGPDEKLLVVWTEYEGALRLRITPDGGESFSDPVEVVPASARTPARAPAAVWDESGRIHLVWTVGEDPSADLRYAYSEDGGGSFSEPVVLAPGDAHADGPDLTASAGGSVHLAWAESEGGPFGGVHRLRHLRWRSGEAPGGGEAEPGPDLTSEGFVSSAFPVLAADGSNDVYMVWELFPDGEERARGLGFARWDGASQRFGTPEVVPGTPDPALGFNGSLQGKLGRKLAVDERGRIAVVHGTFLLGSESRIRLYLGEGRR